jgi:RNA recognition motif-containing protein
MLDQNRDVSLLAFNKAEKDISTPILSESSSYNGKRVSFNEKPQVKEISFNNGKPKQQMNPKKFEIKDKTLILSNSLHKEIKAKAKKYITMVNSKKNIALKYRRRADMDVDLRALGLKEKTYIENLVLVNGLGYKETEQSIREYFSQFGQIEKIIVEKNSKNICTGKASITFSTNINTGQEFRLGNRLLRIERAKKQMINRTRVHVSHMNKSINISKLRAILKSKGFIAKNIKIDQVNGKNKGYGFIEFDRVDQSEKFLSEYDFFKSELGPDSFAEYSKEKNMK